MPIASLLYSPARRGGFVSLDFLELPVSRRQQRPRLLQVHIDLLKGAWLVPTFKTNTAEEPAEGVIAAFEQATRTCCSPAQRRYRRRSPAPPARYCRSRRKASRSRWHLPAIWVLRSWAGRCSTGGPTKAGSAE